MIVGGIFGPKKSGKTTLARELAREYWARENRRSLVLDPNNSDWPECCWQAKSEEEYWNTAWRTTHCLLICDDAAASIARDSDLTDVFTRINHLGHKLLVIGHNGTNLLPIMREQMDTVWLFRSTPKAAEKWYDIFGDETILTANQLQRYEFLYIRNYEPTEKRILTLSK
jgi:GTPase SAR1 family protein